MTNEPSAAPGADEALADLRQRLERLHVHNGEPSTRLISTRTGRAISHTTVNTVLRCAKLPAWGQLELVVEQLGGDVEEFRTLWITARDAQHGLPVGGLMVPRQASGSPADDALNNDPTPVDEVPPDLRTQAMSELLVGFLDHLEQVGTRPPLLSTGITDLDRLLGDGLRAGQLVLIAGRPAIGKSTLALTILRAATIKQRLPALLLSFRMTKDEVIRRLNSAEALIPLHVLRSGYLSDEDWTKLARRLSEIHDAPLLINDSYRPSLHNLITEARRAASEHGIKLVVVDGIQMLGVDSETGARQQEGAEISRSLKLLALELNLPVIAVGPLEDTPGNRYGRQPDARNLREALGFDEAADAVIIVHREDYYDAESPRIGEADLIVVKNVDGPTDIVTVAAQLHLSRFVDMAYNPPLSQSPPPEASEGEGRPTNHPNASS